MIVPAAVTAAAFGIAWLIDDTKTRFAGVSGKRAYIVAACVSVLAWSIAIIVR